MAMMILQDMARRFLPAHTARLVPVPAHHGGISAAARRKALGRMENQAKSAEGAGGLVFLGAIAGLYVAARIALTYAAVTH